MSAGGCGKCKQKSLPHEYSRSQAAFESLAGQAEVTEHVTVLLADLLQKLLLLFSELYGELLQLDGKSSLHILLDLQCRRLLKPV